MEITFTQAQSNRLIELGKYEMISQTFRDAKEREQAYKSIEKKAVRESKENLQRLREETRRPSLIELEYQLADRLCENGFVQVTTPTIISRKFLEQMSIGATHPLNEQVFWLDDKSCLRPMLAPNLYDISRSLMNVWKTPMKIFEIGSCFRKESEGQCHLKEFTMLNLVEWGVRTEEREQLLKEYASLVLKAAGINDYNFEEEESVVYGKGLDVVSSKGVELASSSMGPHPLDPAWGITCSWVGIGFGLERLLMIREGNQGIHNYSKSLSYLDGVRLNIK